MKLADRLKFARNRAGLTGMQVAERTGIGQSSLSEFESGKREPSLSHLGKLARAYHLSVASFLGDAPIPVEAVLWRERPAEDSADIEARFLRVCQQYRNLEVWADDVLEVQLPTSRAEAEGFSWAEARELAASVRNSLQLGDRPGPSLLPIIEEVCGVKVFHFPFEPTGTAASSRSEGFGAAVLLNSGSVRWRRNFDLAHELFHLVTWGVFRLSQGPDQTSLEASPQEEKLANVFAANLLLPMGPLRSAVDSHIKEGKVSYENLYDIARAFDVSIEALLWQSHYCYSRTWEGVDRTRRDIETALRLASFYERRHDTEAPTLPDRYRALAAKVLRRGDISLGRFAEYLGISRQEAMRYAEQEFTDDQEVQIAPA